MRIWRLLLVVILAFIADCSFSQTIDTSKSEKSNPIQLPEWIHNMVYDTASSTKPRFLFYPVVGYAPETKWEFGLSGLVVFHYKNDTTLRLSEISAFAFYTQERQLGLWIDHVTYGKDNNFLTLGKMRFQNYPLYFYGVGSEIPKDPVAVVNANYYSVRERFLYRITGNLFAGLQLDYQELGSTNWENLDLTRPVYTFPKGADGSRNFGLGAGIVLDSRHNMLNVRDGYMAEIAVLHYGDVSYNQFPMTTLFLDGRYFLPTSKNQVLAFQVVGQFSKGDVPFNQLSLMGGETIMRGYYLGRYRDKNYVAAQAEYRFLPFISGTRLGGAVFGSVGAVSNGNFPQNNYKWSAGAGLRYLLFPKKDIFTRIDFGLNPDGYGVYFYIGEAF